MDQFSPPLSTLYPPALDPEHAVNEPQLIGQSLRILVVDENDYNRYTLSLYLELEGYSNLESGGRREGNRSRRSADAVYMTGAAFVNSRRRYLRLHRRRH